MQRDQLPNTILHLQKDTKSFLIRLLRETKKREYDNLTPEMQTLVEKVDSFKYELNDMVERLKAEAKGKGR